MLCTHTHTETLVRAENNFPFLLIYLFGRNVIYKLPNRMFRNEEKMNTHGWLITHTNNNNMQIWIDFNNNISERNRTEKKKLYNIIEIVIFFIRKFIRAHYIHLVCTYIYRNKEDHITPINKIFLFLWKMHASARVKCILRTARGTMTTPINSRRRRRRSWHNSIEKILIKFFFAHRLHAHNKTKEKILFPFLRGKGRARRVLFLHLNWGVCAAGEFIIISMTHQFFSSKTKKNKWGCGGGA